MNLLPPIYLLLAGFPIFAQQKWVRIFSSCSPLNLIPSPPVTYKNL